MFPYKYPGLMVVVGDKFPELESKSLSGKKVKIPDDLKGEINLISVAFVREAQAMLDSWIYPFQDMCEGKSAYELPMIDGYFWKIFSGFIDEGMKAGIPERKHDYVVTYYGDTSKFKNKLGIKDKGLGYVYLLDKDGTIIWSGKGYADEKGLDEMAEHLRKECTV
ncbi:MAG: hypothetical protein ACOC7O_01335 [Thermoplasmatota archaeon]